MIINCENSAWRDIDRKSIPEINALDLLQLKFCEGRIGDIHDSWNRLIDEGDQIEGAKLLHWTAGIPAFKHYREAAGAKAWFDQYSRMSNRMDISYG